ncbi:MAG: CPBP family intramembrane metalloprotease [Ruminococcaceae bacterium]|nr:CPBP family intramembrane metalloprotease [Oscillospiraceae bacterium]
MTPEEKSYRAVVNRIAICLLVFCALFFAYSNFMGVVMGLAASMSPVAGTVLYEIVYGVLYAATFLLPVLLFRLLSGGRGTAPIATAWRMPRYTLLYIFVSIAIISAAGYLNSMLLEIFEYGEFTDDVLFEADISTNYELVLMFFTTAIVPAFVEELLFRGVVLGNLLPYGRTTAVLASALLFGAMHQNAGQLLYATVAGLVLGYIYVYTKSIWCCVLIHFCNNFLSVLNVGIYERMGSDTAVAVLYLIELIVFLIGILCAVRLMYLERDRKEELLQEGAFLKTVDPDPEHTLIDISFSRRVRLFFSVPMIVFLSLCVAQMLLLLLLSLVMT